MAAPVLQFKRGLSANLPAFRAGEPGFATDSYDFYIGLTSQSANNKFFGSARYWSKETTTVGSAVKVVEGTSNGEHFVALKSPNSLAADVTYTFPGAIVDGNYLRVDSTGQLSWVNLTAAGAAFTGSSLNNTIISGVTTLSGSLNSSANSTFSGITTFTNTTDNTLGDENTGSVQLDGGMGVAKNLTVKQNLHVGGFSEFVGVVTFRGGTINLGDADTDDIVVSGEFASSLIPTTDDNFDLGSSTKEWRDLFVDGTANIDDLIVTGVSTLSSAIVGSAVTITSGGIVAGLSTVNNFNATHINATGVGTFTGAIVGSAVTITSGGIVAGLSTVNNFNATHINATGVGTFTGAIVGSAVTITSGGIVAGLSTVNNFNATHINISGISTFTGAIDANGGADISGGETVLSSATVSDLTSGRVVLAGTAGSLNDSADLTFSSNILTVSNTIDVTTLEATNIKAKDGTTSITITNTTGHVGVASDLTVSGSLFVNGSTTQVNTTSLTVEDTLVELGLVDGSAPSSDLNKDLGLLLNYYTTGAKKAAVFWDDSASRIVFADDVSESSSVLTVAANAYASIEVESIFINDCAGQSQLITCSGVERKLENITIDGGAF